MSVSRPELLGALLTHTRRMVCLCFVGASTLSDRRFQTADIAVAPTTGSNGIIAEQCISPNISARAGGQASAPVQC